MASASSARTTTVNIGQPATINVKLEVGTQVDTVEVQLPPKAVQTSTSGNYGNVDLRTGRARTCRSSARADAIRSISSSPSPASSTARPPAAAYYVHGARDRAWNYTLDGIDVNDSSQGGSNTTSFRVNPDMLEELRVLTGNNTAEYGRNSGGQVAMVTRSGTNEFHGDGFWFYRTPRLNANEWQNNLDNLGKAQLAAEYLRRRHRRTHHQEPDLLLRPGSGAARAFQLAPPTAPSTPRRRAPGHPALRQGRTQPARRRRERSAWTPRAIRCPA